MKDKDIWDDISDVTIKKVRPWASLFTRLNKAPALMWLGTLGTLMLSWIGSVSATKTPLVLLSILISFLLWLCLVHWLSQKK